MKEIRMILADLQVSILSMKEAGLQTDVEEKEKALRKMRISRPRLSRSFLPGISFLPMIPVWRSTP